MLYGCVLCALPGTASAAVTINEIAWMGSIESANDEWIELRNTGSQSVALDGWTLTDGANVTIVLSGTIGAGAYAVLERTDDASAPGGAFLIYTGALPNTGATLTLARPDGSIEDQVAGGENWEQIGGDNMTKETAQYTENGWGTAAPTPGAKNAAAAAAAEDQETTTAEPAGASRRVVDARRREPEHVAPDPELSLSIEAPERTYVNQRIAFSVTPAGIAETLLDSVSYKWNFGDGATASGKEVQHAYAYPGEYVVVAYGSFAAHQATTRHRITVLPVTFSLMRTASGDVQVNNDAVYEIDLSGFTLQSTGTFVFPDRTILLPRGTITVPYEEVGAGAAVLFDTLRTPVASTVPAQPPPARPSPAVRGISASTAPAGAHSSEQFAFQSDAEADTPAPSSITSRNAPVPSSVQPERTDIPSDSLPYLGLIAVLSVALFSLFAARRTDTEVV